MGLERQRASAALAFAIKEIQGDAFDFVASQRGGVMFDPDHEGYYGDRIDQIIAADPGVTVLVAPLICNSTPSVQSPINTYNSQIPSISKQSV